MAPEKPSLKVEWDDDKFEVVWDKPKADLTQPGSG